MEESLKKNKINSIPGGLFANNQKLVLLDLSMNNISGIADDAFDQVTISLIFLNGNQFKTFTSKVFNSLSFNSINLKENPIHCDCNIAKFLIELEENNLVKKIQGSCFSPKVINGAALNTFDISISL